MELSQSEAQWHREVGSIHVPCQGHRRRLPQIRVVPNPDVGTLVSVTLSVSPVAQTTFMVLLPAVLVDTAHPVEPVSTEGSPQITSSFRHWVKKSSTL